MQLSSVEDEWVARDPLNQHTLRSSNIKLDVASGVQHKENILRSLLLKLQDATKKSKL